MRFPKRENEAVAAANTGINADVAAIQPFEPEPNAEVAPPRNPTDDVPLDGGSKAWLQVAASFFLYFNHLGLVSSFGVFQSYYKDNLLRGSSPSAISWIGSVQIFCLLAVSVIIGPLYDAGHCMSLLVVGTALTTLGLMMTSISTQYWHILLAQGICVGLGACCISIPSIAIVPMYFKKRRARAMGLATVGSGLGSTLYPLIFQGLESSLGFGWAMRIIGFISLTMCLFAIAVIRPRPVAKKPAWQQQGYSFRFFVDLSAFKERTYLMYCIALFFSNLAFFEPTFYLQSYALEHGMRGKDLAHYLLAILNASSIPGRIIPSFVADKFGVLDTYIVICGFSSSSVFYWISVNNEAGNIAFAVLYGFFSGGVVSLAPVVLTTITPDMGRLGTRLGMVSILKGVASLIGPPISGAILDATGEYLGVQLFSAFGVMLTTVFALALRLVLAGRSLRSLKKS